MIENKELVLEDEKLQNLSTELGYIFNCKVYGREFVTDLPQYMLDIIDWNIARNNLAYNEPSEIEMLEEEADEAEEAKNIDDFIDACCDEVVVYVGTISKAGSLAIPLSDIILAWGSRFLKMKELVTDSGYDFEKCMGECIKHINAREQNPEQKAKWEESGVPQGEKWQKNKAQDPDTLYQPDYESCRVR